MYNRTKELVYALLYAAAAGGLVYCCGSSVGRIGSVPGVSRPIYLIMVSFGGYGAWLCGQTSVEIVQAFFKNDGQRESGGDGAAD